MLEEMFAKQPDHPGLAHYIIHSYDYPTLAARAASAAQRYADIAPSAAHALHMPSHAFTRVGMWNESVKTNQRSMEEAIRTGSIAEALHAADYAVYANLQMRREAAARELIDRIPELAARFDQNVVTGAAPGSAGVFALAAIPARWALEREAWSEAAALPVKSTAFPYTEAMTYLARSIGATRLGNLERAGESVDSLSAIHARLLAAREAYWAEQVAIQHLSASAWLELAQGRADSAEALMRQAATREDATEKAAVTPGPLAPAREQLGDMYFERKRYANALTEYRAALKREPNRYRLLRGAMRAAAAAGDSAAEAEFRREIAKLTGR
jgi:tetratricopeptide (TPR) repeat protein